jgi:integrase/recombinase XerD
VTAPREDGQLIAAFLEMMAAEAGAASNTLLAYERDLRGASLVLDGALAAAGKTQL